MLEGGAVRYPAVCGAAETQKEIEILCLILSSDTATQFNIYLYLCHSYTYLQNKLDLLKVPQYLARTILA